jgi:hypothetical protein
MGTERFHEEGFNDFVKDLANSERLNDTQAGIAKRMLDKGYDSLSEKQKHVFDKTIKENDKGQCKFCGQDIPWSEMFEAGENRGYHPDCKHTLDEIENKD